MTCVFIIGFRKESGRSHIPTYRARGFADSTSGLGPWKLVLVWC